MLGVLVALDGISKWLLWCGSSGGNAGAVSSGCGIATINGFLVQWLCCGSVAVLWWCAQCPLVLLVVLVQSHQPPLWHAWDSVPAVLIQVVLDPGGFCGCWWVLWWLLSWLAPHWVAVEWWGACARAGCGTGVVVDGPPPHCTDKPFSRTLRLLLALLAVALVVGCEAEHVLGVGCAAGCGAGESAAAGGLFCVVGVARTAPDGSAAAAVVVVVCVPVCGSCGAPEARHSAPH